MLDESIAQSLQQQHLTGEPRAIVKLYAECRHLGGIIARSYLSRTGLRRSDEDVDEAIHVSVSRILRRYRNGFRVRSFAKLLGLELTHEFRAWDRGPKRAFLQSVVMLEDSEAAPLPKDNPRGRQVLEDLFAEPNGRRIFFDLAIHSAYRDAVICISSYVTPDRIVTESPKLRDIHRVLHGRVNGQEESHGQRGRGYMAGDAAADRGDQRHPEKGIPPHPVKGGR